MDASLAFPLGVPADPVTVSLGVAAVPKTLEDIF